MKKAVLALLIVAVATAGILVKGDDGYAKNNARLEAGDEAVLAALRFFLSKQDDCAYMVRAYQYSVTTEKNNPQCYLLTDKGGELAKEAGLTKKDKGRFAAAFADRDGARVQRLWDAFGKELLALLSKAKYNETLKWSVDGAVAYRASQRYADDLARLVGECPRPDTDVLEKSYRIGGNDNIHLNFWYRRTMEKNDEVTFKILKEIQKYYE